MKLSPGLEKMEQAEVERISAELSQQVGSHSQELERLWLRWPT